MVGFIITARQDVSQLSDHHSVNRQRRYRQHAGSFLHKLALQIPERAEPIALRITFSCLCLVCSFKNVIKSRFHLYGGILYRHADGCLSGKPSLTRTSRQTLQPVTERLFFSFVIP